MRQNWEAEGDLDLRRVEEEGDGVVDYSGLLVRGPIQVAGRPCCRANWREAVEMRGRRAAGRSWRRGVFVTSPRLAEARVVAELNQRQAATIEIHNCRSSYRQLIFFS